MHSAQQVIYDDAGACPVAARGVTGGVATHARRGRKKAALTYVVTYTLGCATKHWNMFGVLLVGRLFCGVATSLLYSAFESWLVAEHFKVLPARLPCLLAAQQVDGSGFCRKLHVYPVRKRCLQPALGACWEISKHCHVV